MGLVVSTGDLKNAYKILSQNPEGLICTRRWVSGIEMIHRDVGCDWTQKA